MIDPSLHANNNSMYNSAFQNFMVAPGSMSGGAQGFMNPAEAAIHQSRYGGGSRGLGSSPYGYMYDNPIVSKFAMANGILSRPTGTNYASTAMHRANVNTLVQDTMTAGAVDGIAAVAGGGIGASAGAALGTAVLPGIGTAVGAMVGGLLGMEAGESMVSPLTDRMDQRTLEKMSVHKSLGGLANNNSPYGGGFGFSRKAAQSVYQNMEGLASEDAAFSTGEMTAMLNEGISNGTISGNTVNELNEKLEKTKDTIKALSQITGNNKIGEINDLIRQMVTVGFDSGAAEGAVQGMSFAARRLGVNQDDHRNETIQRAQTRSMYGGPDAATGIMVSSAMDSYLANSDIFKTLGNKDKVKEGKEGAIDWVEAQFTKKNTPSLAMSGLVSQSTRSLLDDANAREAFAKENESAIREEMRTSGSGRGAATSNLFIALSKEDRNPWLSEGVKTSDKKEKEMGIWEAYREVRYKARELYSDSTARRILAFDQKSIKDATSVTSSEIAPIRGASQLTKTLVDTAQGLDNQGGKFGLADSMTQEIRAVVQQLKTMHADGGIAAVDKLRQNDIIKGEIDLIKQNSTISASVKKSLAWVNKEVVAPATDWATPEEGTSEGLFKRMLNIKNNIFQEVGKNKSTTNENLKLLTERTMDGSLDLGVSAGVDYDRMSYFGNHGSSLPADSLVKGPQKDLENQGTLALGKTNFTGSAVFGADAVLALSTGGAIQSRYKKQISDNAASNLKAFNSGDISADEFRARDKEMRDGMYSGAKGLDKIIRGAKDLTEKELPAYVEKSYNSLTDLQKAQTNPYILGKEILEFRGHQVIASAKEKLGFGDGIATEKTSGQRTMDRLDALNHKDAFKNGSALENLLTSGKTQYDSPVSQKEREWIEDDFGYMVKNPKYVAPVEAKMWTRDENGFMSRNPEYKSAKGDLFGGGSAKEGFYTEDSIVLDSEETNISPDETTSSSRVNRIKAISKKMQIKGKRVTALNLKEKNKGLTEGDLKEREELLAGMGEDHKALAEVSAEVKELDKYKSIVAKGTKEREDWSPSDSRDKVTVKNDEFMFAKKKVLELEGKKVSASELSPKTPSSGETDPGKLTLATKGVSEGKVSTTDVSSKTIAEIGREEVRADRALEKGAYKNVDIENINPLQVGYGTVDTPSNKKIREMQRAEQRVDEALEKGEYGNVDIENISSTQAMHVGDGTVPTPSNAKIRKLQKEEVRINDGLQIGEYSNVDIENIDPFYVGSGTVNTTDNRAFIAEELIKEKGGEALVGRLKTRDSDEASGSIRINNIDGTSTTMGSPAAKKDGVGTKKEQGEATKLQKLRQDKAYLAEIKYIAAGTSPVAAVNALIGTDFNSLNAPQLEETMDYLKSGRANPAIIATQNIQGTPAERNRVATGMAHAVVGGMEQNRDESIISSHSKNNVFDQMYEVKDKNKLREQSAVDPSRANAILGYNALSPEKKRAAFDAAALIGQNRDDGSASATERTLNSANVARPSDSPLSEKEWNDIAKPISTFSAFQKKGKGMDFETFNNEVAGMSGQAGVKGALKSIWKGVDLSSPEKLRAGQALHVINTVPKGKGMAGMTEPELLSKIKNDDGSIKTRKDIKGDLVANAAMDIYDDGKNKIISQHKLPEDVASQMSKGELATHKKNLAKDLDAHKEGFGANSIYSGLMDKIGIGGMDKKDVQSASRGGKQSTASIVGVLRSIESKIEAAISAFVNSKDGKVQKK